MNTNPSTNVRTSDPMRIFIYKGGEQIGPFTLEEALEKDRRAEITATDQAWMSGESGWAPWGTLRNKLTPPPPSNIEQPPPPPPSKPAIPNDAKIWVARSGKEYGPYTLSGVRRYLREGSITPADDARIDGTDNRLRAGDLLIEETPSSSTETTSGMFFQLWLWFSITMPLGPTFLVAGISKSNHRTLDDYVYGDSSNALVGFGVLLSLAGLALFALLLYRMWQGVYRGGPVTPGKAVGFMFIPLFNFYWQFVAVRGLVVEVNKRSKVQVSEGLAIAQCVVGCLLWVPGLLTPLAYAILSSILFWKTIKAVNVIRRNS